MWIEKLEQLDVVGLEWAGSLWPDEPKTCRNTLILLNSTPTRTEDFVCAALVVVNFGAAKLCGGQQVLAGPGIHT